jgi:hypothetical protein
MSFPSIDNVRTDGPHVIQRSPSVLGNMFSYQDKDDERISLLILKYPRSNIFTVKLPVIRKEILHPWNEL